ncbi:MAG: DUF5719 family protein [Actinomycetia bacterium]|nr:IPT/TIG domain-containing protein [Actinomycetota bacterium]MCG2817585.1 DUF5719 family protein [Actinomycetes bacterium]
MLATVLLVIASVMMLAPQPASTAMAWTDSHGPENGNANALAYDATHNILYRGMDRRGVWKYDGSTWSATGGGVSTYNVESLAYDATHDILYCGTHGHGVWKYDGTTWTDTSSSVTYAYSLAYDTTHDLLYAASDINNGVYKYNGTSWTNTGGAVSSHPVYGLAYDVDQNRVYAGTNGYGVWKYDGTSWTDTGGGMSSYNITCLASDSIHGRLYAGCIENTYGQGRGVYKYDGTTWSSTGGGVSSLWIYSVAYDQTNDLVYAGTWGGNGVWKYNGTTWTSTGLVISSEEVDSLAYDVNNNLMYAGLLGHGVWGYNGTTWTDTGGGVSTSYIYSMAYDPDHNLLYAGKGHPCYGVSKYDGATWTDTGGGLSGYEVDALVYDSAHNLLYAGTYEHGVWKYDGTTWTSTGGSLTGYKVYSLAYDSARNILYAGTVSHGVWKYDGTTWTSTGGSVSGYTIYSLGYDPTNNVLYAGTLSHGVWKYDGTTWISTGGGLSNYRVYALAYDSLHDQVYAGTYAHGVWKYKNGTWTDTAGGSSLSYVYALHFDTMHNVLYAGTGSHGVWKYNGLNWADTGGEITNYTVESLAYDYVHTIVNAGTSIGAWYAAPDPTPAIVSCSPASAYQGTTLDVSIEGSETAFENGVSNATFSGTGITVNSTTVNDPIHAVVNITIDANATIGSRNVNVVTGGENPQVLTGGLTISGPHIDSLSIPSGNTGTTVTIAGGGFGPDPGTHGTDYVRFGTFIPQESDYVSWSTTQIEVKVPADGYQQADVKVHTGAGGDSNTSSFTIMPYITGINPVNGPAGTLVTIDGSAFAPTQGASKVAFGSTEVSACTSWNNGQIEVSVPGMTPGTTSILVRMAVGDSNSKSFTVDNPVPVTTSLSPERKVAGQAGFTLTVNGTNFVDGSVVCMNGSDRTTAFSSANRVTASIPASDITTVGTADVTVHNPAPGGGTSIPQTFTVDPVPVPTTTGLSPNACPAAGDAFTLSVNGTNFVDGISVVKWKGEDRNTTYSSPTQLKASITAEDIASPGVASVTVLNRGGETSNAQTFTIEESASSTWYLSEGTSDYGFETYVTIENPNATPVTVMVTYMTKDGPRTRAALALPAMSQTTINPLNDLGSTDFSTKVECKEGKTIAVDRRMIWTGPGAPSPEGHSSIGVTAPAKTWYLAEGSSKWGFETWLLVQNPNDQDASCTITYMIEGEASQVFEKTVTANSRASFNMETDIGQKDASIKVESDIPVIPERAMYRNNRREGHDSIGTTTPANDFYLAEGTTDWGFTTYVLVQNPSDEPADVTVTYLTPEGPQEQPAFQMDPNSRKTICVSDVLPGTDLSTHVHGSVPIIAERAMYWGADTPLGEACHASVGMDSPHTTFYLPDGETYGDYETWTLVMNPNETDVTVEISYLTPTGEGNVTFTDTVPANSRKTYSMGDALPQGRAAIVVTSKTSGKKIMVERAMYWNSRGAGTDTIGGYSD